MSHPQQDFTFINVTGSKKTNTRAIKRHVSNLTNRRKRQEAVNQYQRLLLSAAESSKYPSKASPPAINNYDNLPAFPLRPKESQYSYEESTSPEQEEEYEEFNPHRPLSQRQPFQTENYWENYQQWALSHLSKESPTQQNDTSAESVRKLNKNWRVAYSPAKSGISVSTTADHITIHIPRIDCPSDQSRMEWALRTCAAFIRGTYETEWKSQWQSKQWFQATMLPLGIWRECFPLSVEFIQAGKMQEAFFILNAALSVTPAFFKENVPGLLIACLGAFMYTCQIADERLGTIVRGHVTQLAMIHLGPHHPVSLLLREQMRAADAAQGRTDILSIAVLNTMAEVFGPNHYVPLSMRFGYVRRQVSSGDYNGAMRSITILEKVWNMESMPAAQLPKFLAFEKAKVINAQRRASCIGLDHDSAGLQDLNKIAERSIQLPVFIPGKGPTLQATDSVILKKLGKHLLLGSHYALALYIYTRIPEVFAQFPDTDELPSVRQDPATLPNTVARILVNHLKKEMKDSR